MDTWKELLGKAGISEYTVYGDWDMSDYGPSTSGRIIIAVTKG